MEGGSGAEKRESVTVEGGGGDLRGTAVDWRGRPCKGKRHGGMRAAAFVLGLQSLEITAVAAVGNNLITYIIAQLHFPLSRAANIVTNFVGTVFLLALLGGFLADSYLGSYPTILLFGFLELSGFILLSVQAHVRGLKPAACGGGEDCEEARGWAAAVFFGALYTVALGSGCVKPNMIAHGADQFGDGGRLSTYFNAAYFAFSVGELVALTLLVWLQTHSGMDVGFGVSAAAMGLALLCFVSGTLRYRNKRPQGSILTPVAQVIAAAFTRRKLPYPSDTRQLHGGEIPTGLLHTDRFRFLDKACIKGETSGAAAGPWRLCTVSQVEQVKLLISVLPIFACTIVFNTVLAQLQTFSVQQGSAMDTRLAATSFHIPPASLQSIPYLILVILVPLYDTLFVPFARTLTGSPSGISPLQRIGFGLFLAVFSMVSAALTEKKRREAMVDSGRTLSIFWIAPQFVIFGVSEMFTAVGLIEFFYKQSVGGMQAFLTAITYCSYSFGFYLSSVLVSMVNRITGGSGGGWLGRNDLNRDRLDLFYWMLAGLSLLNFMNYLFWSTWHSSNPSAEDTQKYWEM